MTLPCPQPGGLPTGRALQPGEEVGKGLATLPGSICDSQAIAENQLLPLLRAVVHSETASSASLAFRKQRRNNFRPGTASWSLSSDFGLSGRAEEPSQGH